MSSVSQKDKLVIFDTTLRDGEQSPGVTLNTEEKIEIAKQLSRLGVDIIEAGFPVASPGDFNAVQRIAREVGPLMEGRDGEGQVGRPMVICGLARCVEKDIQTAYDAIKDAPRHRIHVFLATSDIHLEHKLKITRDQCKQQIAKMVGFAKSLCQDIEFSPEDAGRSDRDFLCEALAVAIKAGATTLNIPDTVGYNSPAQYGSLIKHLCDNTEGADSVTFSTHCHNDLGLATANTLAGITNGARQVEVTINGIGERAGNTALEEVVMNVHTHPGAYPVHHTINTRLFFATSRMVEDLSGMAVQSNKAIVGRNAFLHESGIHQDGVLKNKQTYEIIRPEDVGVTSGNLALGKHSGRHAFKTKLEALGYAGGALSDAQFQTAFAKFKQLADVKKTGVTDGDLHALVSDSRNSLSATISTELPTEEIAMPEPSVQRFTLKHMQVFTGIGVTPTATVTLHDVVKGEDLTDAALARNGPIEAIFSVIQRITGLSIDLLNFNVSATSEGQETLGKVAVRIARSTTDAETNSPGLAPNGPVPKFAGLATNVDIITASANAYVAALNRLVSHDERNTRASHKDRNVDI
ncbi:2-isopropylmalate synthase (Alpha-isopropylmalate synthase) (Alpha-IPM synthetase) [Coemansia sp. RSA 1813]|nr:2-isopropylmalate synthase (Alpha-isopropylmalate synthase) (Alpha-IPM synthetase) [Coemansia sp. RSA 1646]KAJ1770209.1 2-isopropylmalate synthase (Alpha-isopropylmalate synthase) (Alpha-IPM synthetase) [Coemansia sp. RSA 1843]KAJ2090166.1 2-isopropylmalate synthase (Alpha-isopropylmalate synthase) (Alpha-IPM synthetase) [Coemansia sp. RSA 986]KAJ2214573.1 2-isopropylmalate synthase (Alpha-isopropylmalate synthase) (Alpha-IPM synthetase) [Coemansia sp. RSA 487]KAJ2570766.1 2-isopropylmalate 